MKETIGLLVKLQKIDTAIIKKNHVLNLIPAKTETVEKQLREAEASYDKYKQNCAVLEKKKKEKEEKFAGIDEKIKKLNLRIPDIKTNKEYQAHLKEIESAEKERRAAEDEILAAMEMLDTALKGLKAEDAKVRSAKEKIEDFKKGLSMESAEAEGQLRELRQQRATLVESIAPDLYNTYMSIFEVKEGLAVAEAVDGVCQGCNMLIPPQLFVELKKNEQIFRCQQCRRILYWQGKTI